MAYCILTETDAILDIQEIIDYYDEQQTGLGEKFESTLNKHLLILQKNPFFQIRYDDVRCIPLKKFPFMVHFTIHEADKLVIIRAVFHASRNPENWKKRK